MNLFWLIHYARAVDYNLIQPLPGVPKVSGFPEYIASILPFILSLAAVLAVVMIVIGGVEYAVSLSEEGKKNARGRINSAILGLLLALVSYLILYTINPDLTKLKLDIKELPKTSQGGGGKQNQFPCPAEQNTLFCDVGQNCVFTGPPNQYECQIGDVVKPPKGPACPTEESGKFCQVGEKCDLNFQGKAYSNLPAYVCLSKTFSRAKDFELEYFCAKPEIGKDFGGTTKDVAAQNCGGSCPSGQLCHVRSVGIPLQENEFGGVQPPPSGKTTPPPTSSLPPAIASQIEKMDASVEKIAVIVPSGFEGGLTPTETEQLQAKIDQVYGQLPDDYKKLKSSTLVLGLKEIQNLVKEQHQNQSLDCGAFGDCEENEVTKQINMLFANYSLGNKLVQANLIAGETIKIPSSYNPGGTQFEEALIHELGHAFIREKYGSANGDQAWKDLHDLSKKENTGFVAPQVRWMGKPYAAQNYAEDIAMSIEAYVTNNGKYKTGDKRSDEIIAQKFDWLEKSGAVKKMR